MNERTQIESSRHTRKSQDKISNRPKDSTEKNPPRIFQTKKRNSRMQNISFNSMHRNHKHVSPSILILPTLPTPKPLSFLYHPFISPSSTHPALSRHIFPTRYHTQPVETPHFFPFPLLLLILLISGVCLSPFPNPATTTSPSLKSLGQHFSLGHNFASWVAAWTSSCLRLVLMISFLQFTHYHYKALVSACCQYESLPS